MNFRRRGEARGCPHGRQETTLQDKFLIAVVDDDESMREAVKGLLRSLGYDAVAFDRAEDFLNFDRRGRVDCLIADVQMPGLTGPDLHARLVASGETIRTILITAYPDPVVRTRALRAGVQVLPDEALPRRGPARVHPIRARFGLGVQPAAISRDDA